MHDFPPQPASPQAAQPIKQRKRGGNTEPQPAHRVPAVFPPVAQGRSPGSWDWGCRLPASVGLQWHRDRPALTYRCGGSTGLGAKKTRRTCFPFHPPAEIASGHLERVRQFYTVPPRNQNGIRTRSWKPAGKTARVAPARVAERGVDRAEIRLCVNEIGGLVHHGKSIDNWLLLLDLSRFLKL